MTRPDLPAIRPADTLEAHRTLPAAVLEAQSAAGYGVAIFDVAGRVSFVNGAYERMSGHTQEQVRALASWFELVPADERERVRTEISERFSGVRTQEAVEFGLLRRDGRRVRLEATIAPLALDGETQLVGFVRDVTARRELEARGRYQQTLLEAQTEAADEGLLVVSPQGRMISYNRRFMELWQFDEALVAAGDDEAALRAAMDRVVDPQGFIDRVRHLYEPDHWHETAREDVRMVDGRILDRYGAPVIDADGTHYGRLWVFSDVTARRREEGRLALLADVSAALDASLDPETTLDSITAQFVPRLGDLCSVSLPTADGRIVRRALRSTDEERAQALADLDSRYPLDLDSAGVVALTLRTGRSLAIERVEDEDLRARASDEEHLAALRRLGFRSALLAPLRARGRTLGVLTIASFEHGRTFDEEDQHVVDDIARRAGLAYDNACLFEDRRRVAETLQRSLLPSSLPQVPALELGACYRPAQTTPGEVGGDFYDAFRAGEGWALVIGDVCGKGADAAALTAMARHTIRAGALGRLDPRAVLGLLNRAILEDGSENAFCTVALARVEAEPGRARVRLACAGHPAPFVMRADGRLDVPRCRGRLLGVPEGAGPAEVELELAGGDALVLFTDGLLEARTSSGQLGEAGIGAILGPLAGQGAEAIVDGIEQCLVAMGAELRDDLAVLVAAVRGPG